MTIKYYHLTKEQLLNGNLKELLSQLSDIGSPDDVQLEQHFNSMLIRPSVYIMVAVDSKAKKNSLVGTASLFVRPTFLHNCGYVGYIEDVVVDKEYRKQGICKELITKLEEKAKEEGCYKVILSCKDNNIPVYEKCGFTKVETTMRKNIT